MINYSLIAKEDTSNAKRIRSNGPWESTFSEAVKMEHIPFLKFREYEQGLRLQPVRLQWRNKM